MIIHKYNSLEINEHKQCDQQTFIPVTNPSVLLNSVNWKDIDLIILRTVHCKTISDDKRGLEVISL